MYIYTNTCILTYEYTDIVICWVASHLKIWDCQSTKGEHTNLSSSSCQIKHCKGKRDDCKYANIQMMISTRVRRGIKYGGIASGASPSSPNPPSTPPPPPPSHQVHVSKIYFDLLILSNPALMQYSSSKSIKVLRYESRSVTSSPFGKL